jgi:carbamoyltransferase
VVILGISAFYHDSAASLIKDGEIIAAAQEERFSRIKHDKSFPKDAIKYCLNECGIEMSDVDYVSFYDKPFIKFERLLETYLSYAPKGFKSFIRAMPLWIKEKLFLKVTLRREIQKFNIRGSFPKLLFNEHHRSHAASAFFPSPFSNAAVLCIDGVGEWATTSAWIGEGNLLKPI